MRELKKSRYGIKNEEGLNWFPFPFRLRITGLDGETRLHLNTTMKLSTNLCFDGPFLRSVRIDDQLPSSDAAEMLIMFALSCAFGQLSYNNYMNLLA